MPLRILISAAAALLPASVATPALAQASVSDWDRCADEGTYTLEVRIAGCTAAIQAPGETQENRAIAYRNRGLLHERLENYVEALADFTDAIKVYPSYAEAYNSRGVAHLRMGNPDLAFGDYNEALRLDPNLKFGYFNRALLYTDRRDHALALADLDQVIRLDPEDWDAWRMRGANLYRQDDLAGANAAYTEAIRLASNYSGPAAATLFTSRALVSMQERDYDGAIADYNVAIQKNIFDTTSYLGRGTAHLAKKNWQFAFDDLSRFLESNPDVQLAWNQRCLARSMLGHARAEIFADCDRSRNLDPGSKSAIAASGLIALKFGEWQRAFDLYDAGLASHRDEADFLYGRGIATARLGQLEQGWADIARATGLNPAVALEFMDFGVAP